MYQEIWDFITHYVSAFYVLIPIIVGFRFYKYFQKPQKIIFAFIICSALSNALNYLLIHAFHQTSIFLFSIYTVIEFAFMSVFYAEVFKSPSKKIIYPLIILFTICCILNLLFVQQAKVYDTYTHTAGSIIIIVYAMLYFNKQSTGHVETGWGNNSLNWLNTGILLYFAGALAMFISMNYITTREMARWVYGTHNTVLLIEYVLFAIGFSKCKA